MGSACVVMAAIIMGSVSDWDTMRHAADTLEQLGVPHEVEVVSAHRTPDKLFAYAEQAAEQPAAEPREPEERAGDPFEAPRAPAPR